MIMRIILDCKNLLGDSLYLLRPVYEFLKQPNEVDCLVADKGLAYELFDRTFGHDLTFSHLQDAEEAFPSATVLSLNAGSAGELAFRLVREGGRQLHMSEAYGMILGVDLHHELKPPMDWEQIHEQLPR